MAGVIAKSLVLAALAFLGCLYETARTAQRVPEIDTGVKAEVRSAR